MRVLIQRVTEASVEIGGEVHARIGVGMLLLVGIEEADGEEDMEWLAGKVARLRIFDDADGVMNLDITQTGDSVDSSSEESADSGGGDVLAISQFTLHASTRKGNRPSYIRAARPEIAGPLYLKFVERLTRELGGGGRSNVAGSGAGRASVGNGGSGGGCSNGAEARVKTGVFGADMKVSLVNDGPVTILIDSKNRE